jgi:hypothetical protein
MLLFDNAQCMLVNFGKASMRQKVWQQPDRVRMVLDKMKINGIVPP